MPSLASLVRLALPRCCVGRRCPGEWMCDECGPQMRALVPPALHALRCADGVDAARASRL